MPLRSVAFALILLAACRAETPEPPPVLPVPDATLRPVEVTSADELEEDREGLFAVDAFVVYTVGGCPACKGPDPCAPCERSRIQISARKGTAAPLGEAGFPKADGLAFTLDPAGRSVRAFETNGRYHFVVRRERTKTGAYFQLLGATPPRAPSDNMK